MHKDEFDVKLTRNKQGWYVSFERPKSISYYWYSFLLKLLRELMRCEIRTAKLCRSISRIFK